METFKRTISLILCAVLMLSVVVTGVIASAETVPEFDETKPYLKATSEPVKAGEIATVTFEIGNNDLTTDSHKGFWGMYQKFSFDTDVLSLVEGETNSYGTFPEYEAGTDFSNTLVSPINDEGTFSFLYTNSLGNIINIKKNGVLLAIKFKVAEDTQPGTYNLEFKDYSAKNVVNIAQEYVAFTYNQPSITVYDDTIPEESSSQGGEESSSSESQSSSQGGEESSSSNVDNSDPTIEDSFDDKTSGSTTSSVTATVTAPKLTYAKLTGKTKVKLIWSKSANATYYQVFRAKNGSKSFTLLSTVTTTTYTDKKAKGAAKYTYKIRAVGSKNVADSNAKSVSVMSYKAKPKIKVSIKKTTAKVKLTKKVKYASGYQVSYSTSSKFKKKLTKTATFKKTGKLKKLKAGTKYYVRVRAYKTINGKKVYGKWSKVAQIKVK